MLKDKLTPKAIVAALNEHIVGQDDAKKARRGRAAQPLAPSAARPRAARRGDAQEHPDDRPDGLRQDRDQPAAGASSPTRRSSRSKRPSSPRSAMSAATSSRSPATWSRKRCGSSASGAATRSAPRAEEAAMDRLLDALTGKGSSEATRAELPAALRRRQPRPGRGRDRGRRGPGHAVRDPRHGRAGVRPQIDDGQARRARGRASAASSRCPRPSPA